MRSLLWTLSSNASSLAQTSGRLDILLLDHNLIQMDDYPADSCAISPTAFLLLYISVSHTKHTNEEHLNTVMYIQGKLFQNPQVSACHNSLYSVGKSFQPKLRSVKLSYFYCLKRCQCCSLGRIICFVNISPFIQCFRFERCSTFYF